MKLLNVTKKVLGPLSYLMIKHEEKRWYDIYIPFFFSLCISIIWWQHRFPLLGDIGLISKINSLLQVLIGFYIASLAAVATFGNPKIDKVMAGTPPKIFEKFNGVYTWVTLNRRQFLSRMFGYLSFVSLFLFVIGVFADLCLNGWAPDKYLKIIFLFCYSIVLFNLLTTTLLGLYYLAIRIHRHDGDSECIDDT